MLKSNGIVKNLLPTLINAVIKLLKRFRIYFAILIIVIAVLSSIFRALTPWASQYKSQVEHHLSTLLGEKVTISSMETGWYWFEPVVKLHEVDIRKGTQTIVQFNKLLVGINLFSSLWHWQIQPGVLYIDGVKLTARQLQDRWQIDGLSAKKTPLHLQQQDYTPVLAWILAQQKIIIKQLSLDIYLQDGTLIPMDNVNLLIGQKGGRYRLKGSASLKQDIPTQLQLMGDLDLDPYALTHTEGQVYFSAQNFLPAQWQGLWPQTRFHVLDGKTNVQLWIDVKAGNIAKAQGQVQAIDLDWSDATTQNHYRIASLMGNVAWQLQQDGWLLTVDQLGLQLGDTLWPQNEMKLGFVKSKNQWSFYAAHVLLTSLWSLDIAWPQALEPFVAAKTQGQLNNTQIRVTDGHVDYLLTEFNALGWQAAAHYPGVANLAGVLHWQPDEGRLELDSENLKITPLKQPPIHLTTLNTAVDWKELANGKRVSVDRLVLRNPDLLLSGSGMADKVSGSSVGFINASVELSASNAEQWLRYIPANHLKRKLNTWLKKDIHRINKIVGQLTINGEAADFPFDNSAGTFEINAHVSGVDLRFAPHWPISKDIEAYVHVNKRLLDADVVYANLQGVFADQVNVIMKDIGKGRETLLVHGKVNTTTNKAQTYILASPLKKKLTALHMLHMQGGMALDLRLEVPLYPENDEVLALGDISFTNNSIHVQHSLSDINLDEVNGTLQFDQEGVLDSSLNALVFNNPVTLLIQSVRDPKPRTEVKIKGKTSIAVLQNHLSLPLLKLLQGDLWLEGLLVLTDDPGDLDHFQIKSSLVGVAVGLPSPLGKRAAQKVPLVLDVDFNPNKAVHLKVDYGDRLNGDLWFGGPHGQFSLQKGEIRIGPADARPQKQQGLQIVGSLPSFDLQQWRDAVAKLPKTNEAGLLTALHFIDLKMHKATFFGHTLEDLSIKATRLPEQNWGVQIHQARVAASLRYSSKTNTLTGIFNQLKLDKSDLPHKEKQLTLNTKDMPNLDVRIQDFHYGKLNIGPTTLKMTHQEQEWLLDYCKINTPAYQIVASGKWQQDKETQIKVMMQIHDLADTLRRWDIGPVIEAAQGEVYLEGGWAGSYSDFALAKLHGALTFAIRDGRITHLSEQTEEKLGFGKLLSILSLQTIPRRLKLDFSDLANDGYSFDILKGSFTINQGVMTTKDSYIDGPVAYAGMKGNLDIGRQLYDVDLRVSPHITASLPVVATIAGGPIAGIATWVASKIINQGMQQISAYTYKVSGPWKHPVVQQVGIFRKK